MGQGWEGLGMTGWAQEILKQYQFLGPSGKGFLTHGKQVLEQCRRAGLLFLSLTDCLDNHSVLRKSKILLFDICVFKSSRE